MGSSVGVTISRIAVVSMKQPRNSSSTLMMARIISGSLVKARTRLASSDGNLVKEMSQPKGTAAAMMKTRTPEKIRVSVAVCDELFEG